MFNFYKAIPDKTKKIISIILLVLLSVLINQYYGYQGINPIDSFFSFNAGYEVANGNFPFRDYWTITGPFIDFTVALIFKIFGTSWFSYVLHASIFNCIITLSTYFLLKDFKINTNYCFIYSIFFAVLAYPSSGTPFVDHHSTFFSLLGFYSLLLAIKNNKKIFWFIIPIFFGLGFLSKQVPSSYIILSVFFILTFYSYIFKKSY